MQFLTLSPPTLITFHFLFSFRTQVCSFSGFKVYPGRGIKFVRGDARTFIFYSNKSIAQFIHKRNPRKLAWTLPYRQQHRKGQSEEVTKRKARKIVKVEKGLAGLSLEEIRQRRTQTADVREAARLAAKKEIRARMAAVAKKKAEAKKAEKKEEKKAEPKKEAAPAKQDKKERKGKNTTPSKQKQPKNTVKATSRWIGNSQ